MVSTDIGCVTLTPLFAGLFLSLQHICLTAIRSRHIQKTLRKFGVRGGFLHALGLSGLLSKKFGFLHHRATIDGSGPQNFVDFERLVYLVEPFGPAPGTAAP